QHRSPAVPPASGPPSSAATTWRTFVPALRSARSYVVRSPYYSIRRSRNAWPCYGGCSRIYGVYRRAESTAVRQTRLSLAETRILEQFWKLGTSSVREVLESLPEEERVAYTTVQTLVYRLEQKGAVRRVKRIGNAQLFEPAIDQKQFRNGLVRDLLELF